MAKAEAQRLDRKNFIVDGSKAKKLKRVLRTSSESDRYITTTRSFICPLAARSMSLSIFLWI